jgi:hypothetical protein
LYAGFGQGCRLIYRGESASQAVILKPVPGAVDDVGDGGADEVGGAEWAALLTEITL